ncbi:MAG: oxygenase MpaB family protein [Myxococcota bacterium]
MPIRRLNTRSIQKMHPVRDHRKIVYTIACSEFSFDAARAMELAFFRTFAVPSISKVLYDTGKFLHATQCRIDDTDILLSEILESGYDGPRGKRAIARINRIHSEFNLTNIDLLYVLTTFVVEPIKWMKRFAWRPLLDVEAEALYHFWVEVGRRMNIQDIPKTLDAFLAFNLKYESDYFEYTDENHQLAVVTRQHLLSHFLPEALFPFGAPLFHAFLDTPLLEACGLPPASRKLTWSLEQSMRLRSQLASFRRQTTKHRTEVPIQSYPDGYVIEQVGGQSWSTNAPSEKS